MVATAMKPELIVTVTHTSKRPKVLLSASEQCGSTSDSSVYWGGELSIITEVVSDLYEV